MTVDIKDITTGLQQKDDGIWYSSSSSLICYPEDGNELCAQLEDSSFWFKHRNRCITELIRNYPPPNGGPLLDIGGGNGFVTRGLVCAGIDTLMLEPGQSGVQVAKQRGIKNIICATLQDASIVDDTLPAVGLFDVIEHIEDDQSFLEKIHSLLCPRGRSYITVPAYSFLWSNEDDATGHYRRYTINSLSRALEAVGFKVEYSTYIFRWLTLPIFLFRSLPTKLGMAGSSRERANKQHSPTGKASRWAPEQLLSNEVRNIQQGRVMRFGGSCLVVAVVLIARSYET